jgi:Flp pilus assembly pilin Flp
MSIIRRLFTEDNGQDLIEYALLCAFIGVVGAAVWDAIRNGIGGAYLNWNSLSSNLWESPDPL